MKLNNAITGKCLTKERFFIISAVLLLMLVLLPGVAEAREDVVRFGGSINVPADQAAGNVVAFGGSVTVEGQAYNVVAFGGPVKSTGIVRGNAIAFGGSAVIDGPVHGNIIAFGGPVRLGGNAVVGGQVISFGGTVQRHPDAEVWGSIKDNPLEIIRRSVPFMPSWRHYDFPGFMWWMRGVSGILMLALGWLIGVLLPKNTANVASVISQEGLKSFGLGFLLKIFAIPISIALLITVLGIPLIPIFWLFLWAAQLFGLAALGLFIGKKVLEKPDKQVSIGLTILLGLLILAVIRMAPFAGGLALFLAKSIGLGAVLISKFGTKQDILIGS
ncbi:MAG: hypothetical protein AB1420_11015 [Bacillota bacterium]